MPLVSKERVLERFRLDATNSSHFVWLLADLKFYETENHWIFAFLQRGTVTLLPLEPLIPGAPTSYDRKHYQAFTEAWSEFEKALNVQTSVFVSVYAEFLPLIQALRFVTLKVGEEPWVELKNCIPTGNSGKGVRAARNQALRAGLWVEEWQSSELGEHSAKRKVIEEIQNEWTEQRIFHLDGFLNSNDPFIFKEERRYFVAYSMQRAEGYLVTTAIPGTKNYFLEDLVLRSNTPRGVGEMLTLETLVALRESGFENASLGVVSMTTLDTKSDAHLSKPIHFALLTLPQVLRKFYNFDGLALFRRRFKPKEWKSVYLAVRAKDSASNSLVWLNVFLVLAAAFRPRFKMAPKWPLKVAENFLKTYRVSSTVAFVSTLLFIGINRCGQLPPAILSKWGFSIGAPLSEWFFRTLGSDFLYFDALHFWTWGSLFLFALAWTERIHGYKFTLTLLVLSSIFDDLINYLFILKPFEYYQPHIFRELIDYKDVGSSLILMALIGLQICQFKRVREFLFVGISFCLVLKFSLEAKYMKWFVINLNHILFLSLGFCIGKIDFLLTRRKIRTESLKASRRKPPIGKIVMIPTPKGIR